jgi:hypothetical protein
MARGIEIKVKRIDNRTVYYVTDDDGKTIHFSTTDFKQAEQMRDVLAKRLNDTVRKR